MSHIESHIYAKSNPDHNIRARWITALIDLLKQALRSGDTKRAREIERDIEVARENL